MLAAGSDLAEVLRHLEITESTWHRWRRAYAGKSASDARRLKELESENAWLKKLLAEAELDKAMTRGAGRGKMVTPDRRRTAVERLQARFGVSERRACAVVGQQRSTQRPSQGFPGRGEAAAQGALAGLREMPPAAAVARREGLVANPKRTRRLWRDERLQRPPQKRAASAAGSQTARPARWPAQRRVGTGLLLRRDSGPSPHQAAQRRRTSSPARPLAIHAA